MKNPKQKSLKHSRDLWDKRAAIFAIITIALAWIIGYAINHTPPPDCKNVLPEAELCKPLNGESYEGVILNDDHTETVVGWASISEAPGYAGSIRVMVGINPAGEVLGVFVISHHETPIYYEKLGDAKFIKDFSGK